MAHTIYRRPIDGSYLRQIVGLSLPTEDGPNFAVDAAILAAEYGEPKVGDQIRDDEGIWWQVITVGELTAGFWPLDTDPLGMGD